MVPDDPTDPGTLRESGAQIRSLMREASAAGARLVQFPEGAITYPSKRVMSSQGPDRVASSDWSRVDWNVLRSEAQAIAAGWPAALATASPRWPSRTWTPVPPTRTLTWRGGWPAPGGGRLGPGSTTNASCAEIPGARCAPPSDLG
jgi:hypothetical protein